MERFDWTAIVARWPIPVRQAWGERANELEEVEGIPFPESERRAFAEVKARLDAGEFKAAAGDRAVPRPTAPPSLFPEGGR